jgi:hypothetical protein
MYKVSLNGYKTVVKKSNYTSDAESLIVACTAAMVAAGYTASEFQDAMIDHLAERDFRVFTPDELAEYVRFEVEDAVATEKCSVFDEDEGEDEDEGNAYDKGYDDAFGFGALDPDPEKKHNEEYMRGFHDGSRDYDAAQKEEEE